MTSTPSIIPPDLFTEVMEGSVKVGVEIIGALAKSLWASYGKYLPYAVGLFLIYSVWAVVKAISGRWGTLGSIIYHVVFLSILAITIAIKGWEILFDPVFDILYVLAYRFSYWLTGILIKPFR